MEEHETFCYSLKARWLTVMLINFIFGISGITVCSMKLHSSHDTYSKGFLRVSIFLLACLIIFGVIISIAIVKNSNRCALVFSMTSLITLTGTTLYSEASTSANTSYLILFSLFGISFVAWFSLYSYLQILVDEKKIESTHLQSPLPTPTAV